MTLHAVPLGSPDSENVTLHEGVNAIDWLVWDVTVMLPLAGVAEYLQFPTVGCDADQAYVPEPTPVKVMPLPVLESVAPLRVTDQPVPKGSPASAKVTE